MMLVAGLYNQRRLFVKGFFYLFLLFFQIVGECSPYDGTELPQATYKQYAQNGCYLAITPGISGSLFADKNESTNKSGEKIVWDIPAKISGNASLRFGRKLGSLRSELEFTYLVGAHVGVGIYDKTHEIELSSKQGRMILRFPDNIQQRIGGADVPVTFQMTSGTISVPIPGSVKIVNKTYTHLFMFGANFYYDYIYTFSSVTPYVGMGIGYTARRSIIRDPDNVKQTDTGGNIHLQLMVGTEHNYKHNLAFISEFKYLMLPDADQRFKDALGNIGFRTILGHLRYNFGVVYRF